MNSKSKLKCYAGIKMQKKNSNQGARSDILQSFGAALFLAAPAPTPQNKTAPASTPAPGEF